MAITRDEVRHIAKLANLEFGDDEQDRFTRQLSAILDYVNQLDRLDDRYAVVVRTGAGNTLNLETLALP